MAPPLLHRYALRWALDYTDRKTVCGGWTRPGKDPGLKASKQSLQGLVRARVEAQDKSGGDQILTLAECSHEDYCAFLWEAQTAVRLNFQKGSSVTRQMIVGLSILTRDSKLTVYVDGSMRVLQRDDIDDSQMMHGRSV